MNKLIPVIYACDNSLVNYLMVSINSLVANSSENNKYRIHILNTDISKENKKKLSELNRDNVSIKFTDLRDVIASLKLSKEAKERLEKPNYFKLFAPEILVKYEKAVYLEAATVVNSDIAELFKIELEGKALAAAPEQIAIKKNVYGTYVEKQLGINRDRFFNTGVLVLDMNVLREAELIKALEKKLKKHAFEVLQDEEFLNICFKNSVKYLSTEWNVEAINADLDAKKAKLVQYVMLTNPLHYKECPLGDFFWRYAKGLSVFDILKAELDGYTAMDKAADKNMRFAVLETAIREIEREMQYMLENVAVKAENPKIA